MTFLEWVEEKYGFYGDEYSLLLEYSTSEIEHMYSLYEAEGYNN